MRYMSTRGGDESLTFLEILLKGIASNGGLYVPEFYPQLDLDRLRRTYRESGYVGVAAYILNKLAPEIGLGQWSEFAHKAYTADLFGTRVITPIKWLDGRSLGLTQLSNGPTLSFKDLPLQLVARLIQYALELKNEHLNVLLATSGDTGSAAEYALSTASRVQTFTLLPYKLMSEFQRWQMTTLNYPYVHNLGVDRPFDDCQAMVKEVFRKANADPELGKKLKLGAVNSINWARIAAQVVYWAVAWLQATSVNDQQISVTVPSGNYGNAHSADVARKMGIPINTIVLATNENDVLYKLFCSGIYRKQPKVIPTTSPSMDIQISSNIERLFFDLADRKGEVVRKLYEEFASTGEFNCAALLAKLPMRMGAGVATQAEVLNTISRVYQDYDPIIDPHTAVGVCVAERYRQPGIPMIVAETARPEKFMATIEEAIGITLSMPAGLEDLMTLPERIDLIEPDPDAVINYILKHNR